MKQATPTIKDHKTYKLYQEIFTELYHDFPLLDKKETELMIKLHRALENYKENLEIFCVKDMFHSLYPASQKPQQTPQQAAPRTQSAA